MKFLTLFLVLVFAHYLADYPLQGDFLSKAKNRTAPIAGIPWWQALTAHAFIQAGFVGAMTGSIALGAGEFLIHWITDDLKCTRRISYNTDQAIHIACKLLWAAIAVSL